VSEKKRPDPRRTTRSPAAREQAARERAARKKGTAQATRKSTGSKQPKVAKPRREPAPRRQSAGRGGLSFVDMLLIAALVLLLVAIAAGAFFVFRFAL